MVVRRSDARPRGERSGVSMAGLLSGKNMLVMGAANPRSIAWAVAEAIHREGGAVALTYQAERLRRRVATPRAKRSATRR